MSAYDLLQVHALQVNHATSEMEELGDADDNTTETPTNTLSDDADTRLIHAATSSGNIKLPPGDIRCVISKASKRFANKCEYLVSKHDHTSNMSLVDRGANGGVAGNDICVLFKTFCTVDIKGIDNHQLTNVPIGTVGGVVSTQNGPVIAIMQQYAFLGKASSIHSPCHLESYHTDVNDKSTHVTGGLQQIKTLDGYVIPLVVQAGLARLPIRPYTDNEWDSLPHVFLIAE
jgi:hypothetical protein